MKKKMKVLWIVLVIIVLFSVIVYVGGTRGMKEMRAYQILEIDMSMVEDGTYNGSSSISRWGLDVQVTVKNHQVTDIQVIDKKNSNFNQDLKKKVDSLVIKRESPTFDVISGATMTSKGYLIAIADALSNQK